MNAAVVARAICYRVGRKTIVDRVDLAVESGGLVALIGPNGSGKTTLMRLLSGVLRPTAGAVEVQGHAIAKRDRRAVARDLVYLPQDVLTNFEIEVLDAVAMGRYAHASPWRPLAREDWEEVERAIAALGLEELRHRTLPTLSGGERQRVFLARALAQGAGIFLLDEPMTALDVGHQLELMDILDDLHRGGRTLFVAMHDLHVVHERFDRAVLLDAGRIADDGPPERVLRGAALGRAFGVDVAGDAARLRFVRRR